MVAVTWAPLPPGTPLTDGPPAAPSRVTKADVTPAGTGTGCAATVQVTVVVAPATTVVQPAAAEAGGAAPSVPALPMSSAAPSVRIRRPRGVPGLAADRRGALPGRR